MRGYAGWLPGALTVGNLLCGFASILMGARGDFYIAAWLIIAAAAFDGLDGRVARLVGVTGEFGEQLDALADTVSFAVAPAALAFHLSLQTLGRPGWAICMLFTACGVIRLARFNAAPAHDFRYFIGLPIPTAAAIAACPALLSEGVAITTRPLVGLHAAAVTMAAGLMVSRIRFRTFKDLRFGSKAYRPLAAFAGILAGFVAFGEWFLPALILIYLLSPIVTQMRVRRHDPGTAAPAEVWGQRREWTESTRPAGEPPDTDHL